jgi:hypothetical protein
MDYNEELCVKNEEAPKDDDLDMGEGDTQLLKKRINLFNVEVDMDNPTI